MNDLVTFALVLIIVYGFFWVITHIADTYRPSNKNKSIKHRYDFYNPSKPHKPSDPIITRVGGVTFEGRQTILRKIRVGDILELVQEPDNPYDPNAIKVVTKSGEHVGYVPRGLARDLSWVIQASIFSRPAKVIEVVGDEKKDQSLGSIIEIYPPTADEAIVSSNLQYPPFGKGDIKIDIKTCSINVWDLRAVDSQAEAEIKKILDEPKLWNEASKGEPWNLHPKLSAGRLRCKLDDIVYVVEWWTRVWDIEKHFPKEAKKQMGFLSSTQKDN